ncbi:hypothetical protein ACLIMN_13650, partial [Enterococcus faecium]|uniref:hypothetical protein n=1 Tax=Enterococcus faecium TaxID=1352 RepID=UPI003CF59828
MSKYQAKDNWIKKIHTHTQTHLYNGILLSHKEENLPFVSTQMDVGGIMKYARGREIMHDI